jgi:hypothetical protein
VAGACVVLMRVVVRLRVRMAADLIIVPVLDEWAGGGHRDDHGMEDRELESMVDGLY